MIGDAEVRQYREQGYIVVEGIYSPDEVAEMCGVLDELIAGARGLETHNAIYDLEPSHRPDQPRVRRIKEPFKAHPVYRRMAEHPRLLAVLTRLIGPDLRLHGGKINLKSAAYGAPVEWHQDWAFYPHTNDDLLAVGLMLEDVDEANGPLQVIPGSHKGPVLAHTNADGVFCGAVGPGDPDFHHDRVVTLTGKAGSMTVHHVRTLHGSAPNMSDRNRFILFYECLAADAWPLVGGASYYQRLGQRALWDDLQARMICGQPTTQPRVEANPVRIPLPPAPDAGSIFKTQKTGGARSAFAMMMG